MPDNISDEIDKKVLLERLKERKPGIYNEMMRGGKWIRKDLYRWVKFRPGSIPIWSNLYFVPDDRGYG